MNWDHLSRRDFIKFSSFVGLGFYSLKNITRASDITTNGSLFGSLQGDPEGILKLPKGFSYHIVSRAGERMDDGLIVPSHHDGMASFQLSDGRTALIRNHELGPYSKGMGELKKNYDTLDLKNKNKFYDQGFGESPGMGGTTTLIYNTRKKRLESHFLSLAGTYRNCSGGPTPWNTWVSCEEDVSVKGARREKDHGYCFEVPLTSTPHLNEPIPLKALGRFNHEAVAVSPQNTIVYLTEDREDGLLYRFVPNKKKSLKHGGTLQALKLKESERIDLRNWGRERVKAGVRFPVEWITLKDVESPKDDLRYQGADQGAARFARGEGIWMGAHEVYWACTNGGSKRLGQIFKYTLSSQEGFRGEDREPGELELFIEPNDRKKLEFVDNITLSPWGDLFLSEDGPGNDYIIGVTPQGETYKFAKNIMNKSEFAGASFSRDGTTLFVNIQEPGLTLAISGPWKHS